MEDYDIYEEINRKYKVCALIIEDDEAFVMNDLLTEEELEIIPIRFGYDLNMFSKEYTEKTKKLFIYYYDQRNSIKNQQLRIQKHFIHYMRKPTIAYIPNDKKYNELTEILKGFKIDVYTDKKDFIFKIKGK